MISLLLSICFFSPSPVHAEFKVPPLTAPVEDVAGIFDRNEKEALTRKILLVREKTHAQFQVVTLKSLEGDAIESVSIQIASAWKLGDKKVDNGLLIVLAPNERKVRIEVGQGLEGDITDLVSSRIIRTQMVPAFRSGGYAAGVAAAIDSLEKRILKDPTADASATESQDGTERRVHIPAILIYLILMILWFVLSRSFPFLFYTGRGGWGGGGFGGGSSSGGGGSWSGGGGGGGFSGGGASGDW